MTNFYQLIILLVAAIACSTAFPAKLVTGVDKASKEAYPRYWQNGIPRWSPYEGEEAVEQNLINEIIKNSWPRENQLKEQSYYQDLVRSLLDRKPTYNINPRGTNTEKASEQINGMADAVLAYIRSPSVYNNKAWLQAALFRMKGQPESFRISFPWPGMKSSTSTQPPTDPTQSPGDDESSTQPPTEMSMQHLNNILKELMAQS